MSAAPVHADNSAQAEYWNSSAGQRWTDHQEHQDQVLGPVSDRLIAVAAPKPGDRVIDVGCGCGATTIDFAARVGPGGEVLGLDISEPMLARARERTAQNLVVRFERADATVYDFEPNGADLVASRFGVMFFADPARSFANLRKGLKPGGRLVFACWREAKQNPFFVLPLREAGKHAPPLPETNPEDPGPFAFANEAQAKASQPSRPTMPASTIVRMSANSPARSLSSRSKAPRGTRPVLRMAENTVSTSAPVPSPCETCSGRWCLKTCPVGAFSEAGYDVAACAGHLRSAAGGDCYADRPARWRSLGFTRMSALLVYIRTILRQNSAWRKTQLRADESGSGATAEALIGRSL
jgi:SAM-dependent methyltransferase